MKQVNNEGFSLIEITVIIVIIAILVSVAIPNYLSNKERVKRVVCILNQLHPERNPVIWPSRLEFSEQNENLSEMWKRVRRSTALSRADNTTDICRDCGVREALDAVGMPPEKQEDILTAIHKARKSCT